MVQIPVLQGANTLNPTAETYEAKSAQIQQTNLDDQTRKDNDFHKVVKYASDGFIEEAKHYARTKGLEVPEQIFQNADLAKGLALGGDFHGDDKQKARVFAEAYSMTQGTMQDRLAAAHAAAGDPVHPDDREFNRKKRWAEYEAANPRPNKERYSNYKTVDGVLVRIEPDGSATPVTQKQDDGEYQAYLKAFNAALGGMASQEQAHEAGLRAQEMYRNMRAQRPSQGLMGAAPAPVSAMPQQAAPQSTLSNIPQQIPSGLPPGSVMIDTANGRPVYQAPNGERFIDDGNP